eukprot:8872386-Karenia_brevis.AAC.1
MEAPGGVGVGENPKVPAVVLPPASEFKPPDVAKGTDLSSTPLGGGGGGGDPNTNSKEAHKIIFESLPSVPKFRLWKSSLRKEVAGAS